MILKLKKVKIKFDLDKWKLKESIINHGYALHFSMWW